MPRFPIRLLPILLLIVTVRARAQSPSPATSPAPDTVRVYVITVGPGDEVWEKYGHNMLWIHDPLARAGGVDAAYNWGLFDFDSRFFINFIRGNMRYWMNAYPADPVINDYVAADRSVWIQELRLTPDQKESLISALLLNQLPENKFYDYDYYIDNCSTRVRNAVDDATGHGIRSQLEPLPTNTTYRWHNRRLMADDYFIDLVLQAADGHYADRPINQWQESFLPVKFMEQLRNVTTPAGALVMSERTIHLTRSFPERSVPPNRFLPYFVIGLLLGATMIGLGWFRSRWARVPCASVAALWCLVGALGSTTLLYMWLFTRHVAAGRNENLLQITPLMWALVIMIPMLRRFARLAMYVGFAILSLSLLGFVLQVLPAFNQVNGDFLALAIPANAGLTAGLYLAARRARPATANASRVTRASARAPQAGPLTRK